MQPYQHGSYIDWIAPHPRNRPIIIGRGDPEHAFNKCRALRLRKRDS
jgi:hypothetical protein